MLGCQQAIAWLETEWDAKTDAELQSWVDRVIEVEGFRTEVFIDFDELKKLRNVVKHPSKYSV